jgi:hypothetical protein
VAVRAPAGISDVAEIVRMCTHQRGACAAFLRDGAGGGTAGRVRIMDATANSLAGGEARRVAFCQQSARGADNNPANYTLLLLL